MHLKSRSWLFSVVVDDDVGTAGLRGLDVFCDEKVYVCFNSCCCCNGRDDVVDGERVHK